jgi:hypothetical protein
MTQAPSRGMVRFRISPALLAQIIPVPDGVATALWVDSATGSIFVLASGPNLPLPNAEGEPIEVRPEFQLIDGRSQLVSWGNIKLVWKNLDTGELNDDPGVHAGVSSRLVWAMKDGEDWREIASPPRPEAFSRSASGQPSEEPLAPNRPTRCD